VVAGGEVVTFAAGVAACQKVVADWLKKKDFLK
jgi:hypothetical protein